MSKSSASGHSASISHVKWRLDFTARGRGGDASRGSAIYTLHSDPNLNPPGYDPTVAHVPDSGNHEEDHRLMAKRSWDLALAPLKQAPMNLFIMYMAGNSISIFPIMMVGMMFVRPIKALLSISSVFEGVAESTGHLVGQKFVYILGNLVGVAMALYKCSSMGLLPTHSSDWLAFADPQMRMEVGVGDFGWS